jgi:integrase/recombinase XerD
VILKNCDVMVTNVLAVRFFVKRDKESNGMAPVYVRISADGRSVDVSVKRRVATSNWDCARESLIGTRQESKQFNSYLETIRTDLTNIYTDLRNQRKPVSAELIKNTYCGIAPTEQTLLGLIDYHNNHLKSKLEWGTMKNYGTTQKYIQRFLNEVIRRQDLPLSQLTYSFLVDFELYLKRVNTNKHDNRPCGHNTILKHIERLRKMIGVALRNEWIDKDPFIKFQARFIRKERHFLSLEDLKAIEAKEFAVERLAYVRDLFVFSCYTGLAYNEVMTLKTENICRGIDGDWWIMMTRKKTNLPVRVPLLPKAMVLIEKYKRYGFDTLFPSMSNQKLNAYLKEIADVCGVSKHLTFHLARHTFATTVTLTNGVPIETVSKMLGHTSIRTTQIYAKVVEKKVSEDMKTLKKRLAAL